MNTTLFLENINCEGCVRKVKDTLSTVEGITKIDITIPTGAVNIDHAEMVSIDHIAELLEGAGYPEK